MSIYTEEAERRSMECRCPTTEESINDKLWKAYRLSNRFDYSEGFSDREYDIIAAHQDGLWMKYVEKHMSGYCSVQAFIDFDLSDCEANIDMEIALMYGLLERIHA